MMINIIYILLLCGVVHLCMHVTICFKLIILMLSLFVLFIIYTFKIMRTCVQTSDRLCTLFWFFFFFFTFDRIVPNEKYGGKISQ